MDEALPNQSEPKEKQAAGFQLHITTLATLVFIAALMGWANVFSVLHPIEGINEVHTFQGADVHIYGWPLPTLFVDVDREHPKLNPSIECNFIALYYDITVFVLVLVCAGTLIERRTRRFEQTATGGDAAPAAH